MSPSNQNKIVLPVTIEEFYRSFSIDELKKYLDVTEKYLQKAKTEFEACSDEKVKQYPNNSQEFYESLDYEYTQYSETFPRILRSSFLVSIISLFENEVEKICGRIKKKRGIPISLADIKGNLLNRVKLYCKLAGLSVSFDKNPWNEINNYYMVRNCIVHNNGFVSGFRDEKNILKYVTDKNIIDKLLILPEIRPRAVISLSEQFCKEVIETMQDFWVELEKKIADIT